MKIIHLLLALVFTATIFATGCGNGTSEIQTKRFYSLESLDVEPSHFKSGYVLEVQNFMIAQQFDTRQMILSNEKGQFVRDYYNQFVVSPDTLLTSITQQWFQKSGYFKSAPPASSIVDANYVLEGNIVKLFGDFSNHTGLAVVEVQFFLIDVQKRKHDLVFNKTYRGQLEIADNTAIELIYAYEKLWHNILKELEKDIIEVL